MSISAHEDGTPTMRLTHEESVGFPRFIYQGAKKVVGTRSLTHTFPMAYNLTMSQPLYPRNYDSLREPALSSPC